MKTSFVRWQLPLALLALTFPLAAPAQASRLRVLPALQTETFQVATNARIVVGTNRMASLADLKIGDHVSIGYLQENGAQVARRIADGVPHKPRNPGSTPPQKTHTPGTQGLLHTHGVIRVVDVQAATLTIVHRLR
ncbi:exported hypothetical protein [Verrucomicrobia bacterium]|nr:exported hypothetical protein [Verrucomicrobiota bacterium]